MITQVNEIKAEIARLDASIEKAHQDADADPERDDLYYAYADQLQKRRAQLQARLEREEARLVKPQPPGMKAGAFDI